MFSIIIGKREQGKSTLALRLALEFSPRVIIFDPRRQFNRGYVTSDAKEFSERLDDRERPLGVIVYQPVTDDDDRELIPVAEEALARGWESNPAQRFTFLVDEAGDLAKFGDGMKILSRYARKTKTDTAALILTFHRPADVATIFKALPTDLYIFRTTLANDVEWLDNNVGEEVAEQVRLLPDHVFLHVEIDRDAWRVIDSPGSWYIPMEGKIDNEKIWGGVSYA